MRISEIKSVVEANAVRNVELAEQGKGFKRRLRPLFLRSSPGVGKTAIVEQAADKLNFEFFPVMLPNYDFADIGGYPYRDGKTMHRARPSFLPDTDKPAILFLDEVSQCVESVQNVVSQLVYEGAIGEHKIGENTTIVCAGNRLADRAGSRPIVRQLANRVTFLDAVPHVEDWLNHAAVQGWDPVVCGFIGWKKGDALDKFDPANECNPTPRSWEGICQIRDMVSGDKPLITEGQAFEKYRGTIGDAMATEFRAFVNVYEKIPHPRDVIADPKNAPIPQKNDECYALMAALVGHANVKNAKHIVTYLERIERAEFSVFAARDMCRRSPSILEVDEVQTFFRQRKQYILGKVSNT